jgi:putative endonuclease
MSNFVTYVLYSEKFGKIYIGYSENLISRIKSHNHFDNKGHTRKFRPWMVIYVEFFETKKEALKRESELKSAKGRDFIKSQILPLY